jgi:hypothetical protein
MYSMANIIFRLEEQQRQRRRQKEDEAFATGRPYTPYEPTWYTILL